MKSDSLLFFHWKNKREQNKFTRDDEHGTEVGQIKKVASALPRKMTKKSFLKNGKKVDEYNYHN